MALHTAPVIFGSRSPRRRDLMLQLICESRLIISPPQDDRELSFEGLKSLGEIHARVLQIARGKLQQVEHAHTQIREQSPEKIQWGAILTADTVVVATDADGGLHVLGQPSGNDWQKCVRFWFENFYSNRSHSVITGVCALSHNGEVVEFCESTTVEFHTVTDEQLLWYLATAESLGKAGGYGIQGAAGLFVKSIQGSLSNVIGLPIRQVWELLNQWNLLDHAIE